MGEKNVQLLHENGLISTPADMYMLKIDDLINLERFAEKSADNLIQGIQVKKSPSLHRFLYGLGIRHVGTQTAVDLANHFHSLDAIQKATYEQLMNVEGVGMIVAESIIAWFADPSNQKLLDDFEKVGVQPQKVANNNGALSGKSFVITGTLESMGREEVGERIRSLGGTFQSSVGKGTDYLVAGSNVGSSKLEKARTLGIEVINEKKLLDILDV
jgi:DNA ligase (NAD+)